jgi:hypothetical protein
MSNADALESIGSSVAMGIRKPPYSKPWSIDPWLRSKAAVVRYEFVKFWEFGRRDPRALPQLRQHGRGF